MKKENTFIQHAKEVLERFGVNTKKTQKDLTALLFAKFLLAKKDYALRGRLNVDRKTWKRLKAVKKHASRLRVLNSRSRTDGRSN